ncbi:MAG: glycine zipper domain-containing protein [Burkholderiales bacterium]
MIVLCYTRERVCVASQVDAYRHVPTACVVGTGRDLVGGNRRRALAPCRRSRKIRFHLRAQEFPMRTLHALVAAAVVTAASAHASDLGTGVGGAVGAGAGAAVGQAVGGASGAAVSSAVGGGTGAVIGAAVGGGAGAVIGANMTEKPKPQGGAREVIYLDRDPRGPKLKKIPPGHAYGHYK